MIPLLFADEYNFTFTVSYSDHASASWIDVTAYFSIAHKTKHGFWLSTQNTSLQGFGLRVNITIL